MIYGIDFDGTAVTHDFPEIGDPVPFALAYMRALLANGHKIILWTMRSGPYLEAAVEYLESNGIELFGVNENPEQHTWTDSPKAYAQVYIDDAAAGCPLIFDMHSRPYVDWPAIFPELELPEND